MTVKRADGWPLSQDELKASKKALLPEISFESVIRKYSSGIEEIGSSSFSHKCICPNPKHKNGRERTPSFYFSESDKSFMCFGCSIKGDVFDLIGLMEGMPWTSVVKKLLDKKNIDIKDLDLSNIGNSGPSLKQYIFDTNIKIGIMFRNYLLEHKDLLSYKDEKIWVDNMFKKIDRKFDRLEEGSKEQVKAFELQVLMELERRKMQQSR